MSIEAIYYLRDILEDIQDRITSLGSLISEASQEPVNSPTIDRYKHKIQGLNIAADLVLYRLDIHADQLRRSCHVCGGSGSTTRATMNGPILQDCPSCGIEIPVIQIPRSAR